MWRLSRGPDSVRDVLLQTQWAVRTRLRSAFSARLMLKDELK